MCRVRVIAAGFLLLAGAGGIGAAMPAQAAGAMARTGSTGRTAIRPEAARSSAPQDSVRRRDPPPAEAPARRGDPPAWWGVDRGM